MLERQYKSITEAGKLRGVCVLLRVPLNVPLEDGVVTNTFRLESAVETISYLRKEGARIILLGHIGREPEATLAPVAEALSTYVPLTFIDGLLGDDVVDAIAALTDGDVLMLENVRSDAREEANDAEFGKALAALADIYVNDAFADSHRAHASIVGVPKYIPSYGGLAFIREHEALEKALVPSSPSLFILGGAKFETKVPLVEKFLDLYDLIFIGGALANDALRAKGFSVGTSKISDTDFSSLSFLQSPKLILPIDLVVKSERGTREVELGDVAGDEAILDVGPKTSAMLREHIMSAKSVLWNGTLGYYEGGFDVATKKCAKDIAESGAHSILGGGDTIASIEPLGMDDAFSFLSTAGGAMLTFLEEGTLPGIDALSK